MENNSKIANKLWANKWVSKCVFGNIQHGIIFSIFFVHYQRLTVDLQISADPMVSRWRISKLARWFISWKIPKSKMDDDWGSMGSPILGTLHILEMMVGWWLVGSWHDVSKNEPKKVSFIEGVSPVGLGYQIGSQRENNQGRKNPPPKVIRRLGIEKPRCGMVKSTVWTWLYILVLYYVRVKIVRNLKKG